MAFGRCDPVEIISIINWFNPVVYLYRKAIKYNHEFTADDIASQREESKSAYAVVLLSKTFGISTHQLTNSFYNHSLLKRRIMMLHKSKSTRHALLKYGLLAPLFAGMMILSSATISNKIENLDGGINNETNEMTVITFPKAIDNQVPVNTIISESILHFNAVSVSPLNIRSQSPLRDTVPDIIFTEIEVTPEPVGGMEVFYKYFTQNFKYPEAAKEKNIGGKIILKFVVEKDGKLSDIKVLRGLGSELDKEIVRLLTKSPDWKPGIQNGHPVRVEYTMPFLISPQEQKTGSIISKNTGYNSIVPGFEPLYIVDGKEATSEQFNNIDSKTIKEVHILKDDMARIKYGEKGKYGVVMVYVNTPEPANATAYEKNTTIRSYETKGKKAGSETIIGHGAAPIADIKTAIEVKDNIISLGNFKGLIIIDGIESSKIKLKDMDTNNIESINVLKDELAIKKYGDKGKNGVIEITSKKK